MTTITDPRSRAILNTPRWVYGNASHYSLTNGCPMCGTMHQGHRPCEPVECLLCGTIQCKGCGSGDCHVCLVGWQPGWWRGGIAEGKQCSRARCEGEAVCTVRKRRLCRDHALATTYGPRRIPMAEHIAARIAHRDSGRGWERFRLTGPLVAW